MIQPVEDVVRSRFATSVTVPSSGTPTGTGAGSGGTSAPVVASPGSSALKPPAPPQPGPPEIIAAPAQPGPLQPAPPQPRPPGDETGSVATLPTATLPPFVSVATAAPLQLEPTGAALPGVFSFSLPAAQQTAGRGAVRVGSELRQAVAGPLLPVAIPRLIDSDLVFSDLQPGFQQLAADTLGDVGTEQDGFHADLLQIVTDFNSDLPGIPESLFDVANGDFVPGETSASTWAEVAQAHASFIGNGNSLIGGLDSTITPADSSGGSGGGAGHTGVGGGGTGSGAGGADHGGSTGGNPAGGACSRVIDQLVFVPDFPGANTGHVEHQLVLAGHC